MLSNGNRGGEYKASEEDMKEVLLQVAALQAFQRQTSLSKSLKKPTHRWFLKEEQKR